METGTGNTNHHSRRTGCHRSRYSETCARESEPTSMNAASHPTRRIAAWSARLLVAALPLAIAGCTVGPAYVEPGAPPVDEWGELSAASPGASTRSATRPSTAPPIVQWWTVFGDPQLDSLVERAV